MQEELTCERCAVPLRMEDVDAARDAGICPRCGDLVRGKNVREVGYRSLAPQPPQKDGTHEPAYAPAPISSRAHRTSSRSLSWWSEMPLPDGVSLRVTSDSHALMPKLFAGLLFMLFGTGLTATMIGSREAEPPPFLVLLGLGCAIGGGACGASDRPQRFLSAEMN